MGSHQPLNEAHAASYLYIYIYLYLFFYIFTYKNIHSLAAALWCFATAFIFMRSFYDGDFLILKVNKSSKFLQLKLKKLHCGNKKGRIKNRLTLIRTKTSTGTKSSAPGTESSLARLRRFMMVEHIRSIHWTLSRGVLYALMLLISDCAEGQGASFR